MELLSLVFDLYVGPFFFLAKFRSVGDIWWFGNLLLPLQSKIKRGLLMKQVFAAVA